MAPNKQTRMLDGREVSTINADLTALIDVTQAKPLRENRGSAFIGDTKKGPFDVPSAVAKAWLSLPRNPNGRPNSDVVVPYLNGLDVTRRPQGVWIVDFGVDRSEGESALYEAPFAHVGETRISWLRINHRETRQAEKPWLHARPATEMRSRIENLERFIITAIVAKYRLFVWAFPPSLPDHKLCVFSRQDDYFFGVLSSRAHELWSLRVGSWHGVGNDPVYTPTTCFETFPLPWSPGKEPWRDERVHAIAQAAQQLDEVAAPMVEPAGRERGGAQKAHADQPLQCAADLVGESARRARSRGVDRLRLDRRSGRDDG